MSDVILDLKNLTAGQVITGIALMRTYKVQPTKNGGEFISGVVASGVDMPFKAWSNSPAFKILTSTDLSGLAVRVQGKVDDYGGSLSILAESVVEVEGFTADQFLPQKYDAEGYLSAVKQLLERHITEKGQLLCKMVLFDNQELVDRFKIEFAASSHHDNCKSGLLAHTYKVLYHLSNAINCYRPMLVRDGGSSDDWNDLLFIGALLHDIGKTVEMKYGVYQPEAIVTHRYLGIEFIAKYKEQIVAQYDEIWYYNLVSIILQHHGEYGDPCKTVASLIIHKVDMFESEMTLLQQTIEQAGNKVGADIKFDGSYLKF